jgi:hypothetical protein
MVAITAVASYALLEIDMGQVGDQLRENGSTDIHPPLFRQRRNGPRSDFRPFSVQIVFSSKAGYPADYKSLTGLCKVLYRTPVKELPHMIPRAHASRAGQKAHAKSAT